MNHPPLNNNEADSEITSETRMDAEAPSVTLQDILPEQQIAIAEVLGATTHGYTPLRLLSPQHPALPQSSPATWMALSSMRFSNQDIHSKIACVRMADTDTLMIVGRIPETGFAEFAEASRSHSPTPPKHSLSTPLDTLLETHPSTETQSDQALFLPPLTISPENQKATAQEKHTPDTHQDTLNSVVKSTPEDDIPQELILRAQQRITLLCGTSHLTLHGDGRVHIRGEYIYSRARRTQQISGGSVKLN